MCVPFESCYETSDTGKSEAKYFITTLVRYDA